MKTTKECPHRITIEIERRKGTCLCIEPIQPLDRCRLKIPENWKGVKKATTSRWLLSGGSPLVLGTCSTDCPLNKPQ